MLETKYYFKDEFGQEIETRKTYTEETIDVTPAIDLLFSDFKNHLRNCGYSKDLIDEYGRIYFGE